MTKPPSPSLGSMAFLYPISHPTPEPETDLAVFLAGECLVFTGCMVSSTPTVPTALPYTESTRHFYHAMETHESIRKRGM